MLQAEQGRVDAGAAPRDMGDYSGWRDRAPAGLVGLMDLYLAFLAGQFSPESRVLRIEAAVTCLRMMGYRERDVPDAVLTLNAIHLGFVEDQEGRRKSGE